MFSFLFWKYPQNGKIFKKSFFPPKFFKRNFLVWSEIRNVFYQLAINHYGPKLEKICEEINNIGLYIERLQYNFTAKEHIFFFVACNSSTFLPILLSKIKSITTNKTEFSSQRTLFHQNLEMFLFFIYCYCEILIYGLVYLFNIKNLSLCFKEW